MSPTPGLRMSGSARSYLREHHREPREEQYAPAMLKDKHDRHQECKRRAGLHPAPHGLHLGCRVGGWGLEGLRFGVQGCISAAAKEKASEAEGMHIRH